MKKFIVIIISIILIITGCSKSEQININNGERPLVYVSFYPMYFLADEIGGDNIELRNVTPNGVDSHHYEPSMSQLKDIEKAQVFIYNGSGFESWVNKLLGNMINEDITINASDSVDLIMQDGRPDSHIWLNPSNMIKIGEKIKEKFISLDRENKEEYEENFEELSNKLKELDDRFITELEERKHNSIIVSHAAFAYMAQRYEIEQIPVTGISHEQEPTPGTIADIIELVEDENHKYIFLETLASPKTVEVIAKEANLKTLTLNPIEGLTKKEQENNEDYISIMEKNLENLKKALVE
ncbi:metal ABC transporter solute-binding protein, Zn/Mn family [Schnuerera sp. xch1]|uniref:metal ABC transporter solute-binding protein, Zn/Mn family n=1 Tax=Schnuerera sp. xch1 TaxID=2874283 RepID=UPI001CBAC421|nr:zinc ABC transporter substrate-binding protein [Schnuerera sp. xch1]